MQGFGNVGSRAALRAGISAASRSSRSATTPARFTIPKGLDIAALVRHVGARQLAGFSNRAAVRSDAAADAALRRPGAGGDGAGHQREERRKLKCRILAEGANGPTTPEADQILDKRQDNLRDPRHPLQRRRRRRQLLRMGAGPAAALLGRGAGDAAGIPDTRARLRADGRAAKADNIPHRTAAMAIGVEKVRAAKNTRGLFP